LLSGGRFSAGTDAHQTPAFSNLEFFPAIESKIEIEG